MSTYESKDDEISPALKAHLEMMENVNISSLSSEIKLISEEAIPKIHNKMNDMSERIDQIDETLKSNKEASDNFNGRLSKAEDEIECLEGRVSTILKDSNLTEFRIKETEDVSDQNSESIKKIRKELATIKSKEDKNFNSAMLKISKLEHDNAELKSKINEMIEPLKIAQNSYY